MRYKKIYTKKDIENDPRVDKIHKEFGYAGENKWGWWCYLKDDYIFISNNSQTINERTIANICYELNNNVKKTIK